MCYNYFSLFSELNLNLKLEFCFIINIIPDYYYFRRAQLATALHLKRIHPLPPPHSPIVLGELLAGDIGLHPAGGWVELISGK